MPKLCLPCARGLHDECQEPSGGGCCCPPEKVSLSSTEGTRPTGPMGRREVGTSAGRKEAARLYPIDQEAACEWRGLANVGGGEYPIVGCIAGFQQSRHHGPVKNTTENSRHNIHLICHKCHNTWHAKNDPTYDEELNYTLPHKPRPATTEELIRGNRGKPKEIADIKSDNAERREGESVSAE